MFALSILLSVEHTVFTASTISLIFLNPTSADNRLGSLSLSLFSKASSKCLFKVLYNYFSNPNIELLRISYDRSGLCLNSIFFIICVFPPSPFFLLICKTNGLLGTIRCQPPVSEKKN